MDFGIVLPQTMKQGVVIVYFFLKVWMLVSRKAAEVKENREDPTQKRFRLGEPVGGPK